MAVLTRLLFVAGALLLAGSCTGAARDGDRQWLRGPDAYPETLSVSARYVFERYEDELYPLALVVAPDGGYATYWRCNGPNCQLDDAVYVQRALQLCQERSHIGDCLVHSIRNRVLWPKPTQFDTEIRARLVTPWKHKVHGAEAAEGAIVHVPGYGGHRFPPALDHPIAPYFLGRLNKAGYDTFRLNIAHFDYARTDFTELSSLLRDTVRDLRARGYERVFLNGQSRGAWEILSASSKGLNIDGATLTAPAAHGRAERWNGETNQRHPQAFDDFEKLLAEAGPYPFLFAFFTGDPYDPGGRGAPVEALRARTGAEILLLDRPDGFEGHGAGGRRAFHSVFGDCIATFLNGDTPDLDSCRAPHVVEGPLDVTVAAHLVELGGIPVPLDELADFMRGRALFPISGPRGWWGYFAAPDGALLQWFPGHFLTGNTVEARWQADADGFCVLESPRLNSHRYCYDIYALPEGRVGLVAPDGLAFVIGSETADRLSDLPFRPGDWMGEGAE